MSSKFKRLLFLAVCLTLGLRTLAFGAACRATADGNWSAGATWSSGGCTGPAGIPAPADTITISTGINVTLDVDATISGLTFDIVSTNSDLTQNANTVLTVNGPVTFLQPGTNTRNNNWNINNGSAVVSGLISFNGTSTTASRISRITIISGQLDAGGGMNFQGNTAATKVIVMSGGAGTLNIKGAVTFSGNAMTLTAGTLGSIVNYNDDTNAQVIRPFPVSTYRNLRINNTSPSGATLAGVFTSTNVSGNLRILSGTLKNGGFAFNVSGDIFEIADGATFEMTGTAAFPGGFSIWTFGPTSRIRYLQSSAALTITTQPVGHLDIMPSATGTRTFPAGNITIAGDLTLGNGSNTTTVAAQTNNTTLSIGGNLVVNPNTTFTAHATNPLRIIGDWNMDGGVFVHNNSTISFNGSSAQYVRNRGQAFAHIVSSNPSSGGLTFTSSFTATRLQFHTADLNSSATIYFAGGRTFTISTISINGTAAYPAVLRSTESGTAWNMVYTTSHAVTFADIKDSNASGRRMIDYPGGYNAGNNTNWVIDFSPPTNLTVTSVIQTSIGASWTPDTSGDTYTLNLATSSNFVGTLISSNTAFNSASLGSLSINTTYHLRVSATVDSKGSSYSATLTTSTLANAPAEAGTTWTNVLYTSITVNWLANSNPAGTTYIAEISTVSGFSHGLTLSSETFNVNATFSNLAVDTTYYAQVRALSHRGVPTTTTVLPSTITRNIPVPYNFVFSTAAPSSLTANWGIAPFVAHSHTLELSTASDFTGTLFSSNTVLLTSTRTALAINTTYYGRVNSILSGSSSPWSSTLTTATRTNDPAPAAAPWSAVFFTSATFNWLSNSNPSPQTIYRAQLSTAANFVGDIISSITVNTSATFNQLDSGGTYYARVQSINHSGIRSNFITSASTRTQASAIPFNVFFSTAQTTTLTATWSSGTVAGNTYTLEVATSSDFGGTIRSSNTVYLIATVDTLIRNTTYYGRVTAIVSGVPSPYSAFETTSTLAADPTSDTVTWPSIFITSTTVQWSNNSNPTQVTRYLVDLSSVNTFPAALTRSSTTFDLSAVIPNLRAQTTYYGRVRALGHSGLWSNYYVLGSTLTKFPIPPADAQISAIYITSATLSWSAPTPAGDTYLVQMSSHINFIAGTVQSSHTALLSGTPLNLLPNTTQYARVSTILHGSSSVWSTPVTTATLANIPATAVSTWSAVFLSSVTMSWNANSNPSNVTRYRAEVSIASDFSSVTTSSEVLTTSAVLSGLDTATVYYGRVLAINHAGNETDYRLLGSTQTRTPTSCNARANGNWSAGSTWFGCTGVGGLPSPTDSVIVNATVTVTVDVNATVAGIAFATSTTANNGITHSGTSTLTVNGNVVFWQPTTTGRVSEWAINAATAVVNGSITFNGTSTNNRVSRLTITSGQLDVLEGMTFQGTTATNKVILMSGGAGTLNLKGNLTFSGNAMTLTGGTAGSVVNYNDDTNAQLIRPFPVGTYCNIHINNTSASGATMASNFTSTNTTRDFRVQSGTFRNGGFALSTLGDTFEVADGATFEMTGTSAFPTAFSFFTFGSNSRVRYLQTSAAITLSSQPFGHLDLMPSGTATHTFPTGAVNIAGDLTLGNGTNVTTIAAQTNSTTLNIGGSLTINPNTTFTAHATNPLRIIGDWNMDGGVFVHNNSTISFNGSSAQYVRNRGQAFAHIVSSNPSSGGLNFTSSFTAARLHLNTADLSSSATLYFAGNAQYTISTMSVNGTATWPAVLRSSEQTTAWLLNNTTSHALSYVDVRDSNAASSPKRMLVNPAGTNSGNNTNWAIGLNAPANLTFTAVTADLVVATWNAASPTGDTYHLELSTDSNFIGTNISSITAYLTATTNPTLQTNTTYYGRLRTIISGVASSWASTVATATLADIPATVAQPWSSVLYTSATVNWSNNSNPLNKTQYRVDLSTRDDFATGTIISSATTALAATISGLNPGSTYYGRVQAINHSGRVTSYLDVGSTETLTVQIPTGVFYSSAQVNALSARWTAGGPAHSYLLQISTDSNFDGTLTSSNTAVLTATTTASLIANTTYYGRIAAILSGATSTWTSSITTATLAAQPLSPAQPWTSVQFTSVTVSWQENGNPTALTRYLVQLSSVSSFAIGDIISSVTYNSAATFTGLESGNTYYARVWATNHSNTNSAFTLLGGTKTRVSPLPIDLRFTTATAVALTAAWTVGAEAGDSYTFQLSTAADFTGTVRSSNTVLLSATIDTLSVNTTYYGRINGIKGGVPSPFSTNETTSTLVRDPNVAGATWTVVHITSFTVQWSTNGNPTGVTRYLVETSSVSNFASGVTRSSDTYNTSAILDSLRAQTTYYGRVRAFNHSGIVSNFYTLGSTWTKISIAPTNLAFNNVQTTTGTLEWSAPDPAGELYTIQMSSMTNFFAGTIRSSTTANLFGDITGLLPNTTYYGRAQTILNGSSSVFTTSLTTVTLANIPATVVSTWTAVEYTSATMHWSSNQNPAITRYRAELSETSDFSDTVISSEVTRSSATFTSLNTNTVYYGRVLAINHDETTSDYRLLGSTTTRSPTSCFARANGNWSSGLVWQGCTGVGGLPAVTDAVTINSTVTVNLNIDATVAGLTFAAATTSSNTLTHVGTNTLTVNGSVTFNQPTTSVRYNDWNINAATATVSGTIFFNGVNTTVSRISRITITSGKLEAFGGMNFQGTTAVTKVILMSGGAGTLEMKGALTFAGNSATLTAGTASTFNYNGNTAQTVRFLSTWLYNNLHINTGGTGASLGANLTGSNVIGNLRVQSGKLSDGGFSITGTGSNTFEIADGATFEMLGFTSFPGSFSSTVIGADSTIRFRQLTNPLSIPSMTYGNLELVPDTNATQNLPSGSLSVQGTLTIGDGSNTTTVSAAHTSLTVGGSVSIVNSATLSGSTNPITVSGDWSNSGTYTHNNGTVTFNSGTIQTLSGSTTFYGLRSITPSTTLKFTEDTTHYVTSFLDLENISLRSTTDDEAWHFKFTGSSQTLLNINVRDSNASTGNTLAPDAASTNAGNNINWDFTAPTQITNLSATTLSTSTIQLTWSAPSDDVAAPLSGTYAIQYTTWTGASFSTASAQVVFSTSNVTSGVAQIRLVHNLTPNTTHFFRIWTADPSLRWSTLSNGATAVTLVRIPETPAFNAHITSITVTWPLAPGRAARYLVQASTSANFSSTIYSTAATNEYSTSLTVQGLYSLSTYYVRLEVFNWLDISSFTVIGSTKTGGSLISVNIIETEYNFGLVPQGSTNVATSSVTVTNTGNAPQKYRIRLTNPAGWTAVSGMPTVDEYRFSAAFSETEPLYTDFDAADIVTTSDQTAGSDAFAIGAESQNVKGYDVPADADRGLWFKFDAPTESSVVPAQSITITITAEAE